MNDVRRADDFVAEIEMCERCGHPFDDHQLFGELPTPKSGWMTCPVADCDCRMTWSMSDPQPPGDAAAPDK